MIIRKGVFVLILLLAAAAGAAAGYALVKGDIQLPKQLTLPKLKPTSSPTPPITPSPQESVAPTPANLGSLGTITGSPGFPASKPPADLHVCAQNTADEKVVMCTDGIIPDDTGRHVQGMAFRLDLPAGTYRVFTVSESFNSKFRGYYTKAVVCGREAKTLEVFDACKDHTIEVVTVKAGETTRSVDAIDYYTPENDFSAS